MTIYTVSAQKIVHKDCAKAYRYTAYGIVGISDIHKISKVTDINRRIAKLT